MGHFQRNDGDFHIYAFFSNHFLPEVAVDKVDNYSIKTSMVGYWSTTVKKVVSGIFFKFSYSNLNSCT